MAEAGRSTSGDVMAAAHELIARYAHAVDSGRFDNAAACFADDGVLDVLGAARTVGPDAIAGRFAEAGRRLSASASDGVPFVRHHVSSVLVEPGEGGDSATVRSYFLVLTEIGLDHWGRYVDRVVRLADGTWRFAERRVSVEGRTGPSRMA